MWRDISIPMGAATPEWPGDHPFTCGWAMRRERGESVNLATVTTSFHVGTHADAPLHVCSDWPASDGLDPGVFIGYAVVLELPYAHAGNAHQVTRQFLQHLIETLPDPLDITRVLFRTGSSIAAGVFPDDWTALTPDAANWLVDQGVKLCGVDAPSVDRRHSKSLEIHHALLGRGVAVLENLDLRDVPAGHYELLAAPLAVAGADAAPVRALLRARPPGSL